MRDEGARANLSGPPIRVIDVAELGWDAALVRIEGQRVLLLDSSLNLDDRMDVLTSVLENA